MVHGSTIVTASPLASLSWVARLMLRPFAGYAELATLEGDEAPRPALGALRFLLVFGAFVAFTGTGRLVPFELVGGALSFAYVPLVHAIALALALRLVARRIAIGRAFALYGEGYGPWFLFFIAIVAGCFFLPNPAAYAKLAGYGMLATIAWSFVITFALFRRGLALTWWRSLVATGVFYFVTNGFFLGYFLAAGQLAPIVPR